MSDDQQKDQELNELRNELRETRRKLEDSGGREKQLRNENITLEQRCRQAELEISRLKSMNQNATEVNGDLDGELSDLREFLHHVVRDLGLDGHGLVLRDVRSEIRKRCKATMAEALGGDTILKLRKILDPDGVYTDVVTAAQAIIRGRSKGASPSGELASAHKAAVRRIEELEQQLKNASGVSGGSEINLSQGRDADESLRRSWMRMIQSLRLAIGIVQDEAIERGWDQPPETIR